MTDDASCSPLNSSLDNRKPECRESMLAVHLTTDKLSINIDCLEMYLCSRMEGILPRDWGLTVPTNVSRLFSTIKTCCNHHMDLRLSDV